MGVIFDKAGCRRIVLLAFRGVMNITKNKTGHDNYLFILSQKYNHSLERDKPKAAPLSSMLALRDNGTNSTI
jgi:hypothetical protein